MKQLLAPCCRCRVIAALTCAVLALPITASAQTQTPRQRTQPRTQQPGARAPQRREQPAARQAANPRPSAAPENQQPAERPQNGSPEMQGFAEVHMPRWLPISPEHQTYINKLLIAWEAKSARIDRYQCEFTRWRYDLGYLPNSTELITDVRSGKEAASEIVKGIIKFESPDKALFQVLKTGENSLLNPTAAKKKIGPWRFDMETRDYREATLDEAGEHWICDGEHFYEFVYRQQMLRKIPLPPEARGDAIARGPLPFLFRAKANDISSRFWLRIVTPNDEKEAYHLEATPKNMEDASQFGRVIIILDREEFLPKALIIYPVGSKASDDLPPDLPPGSAPPPSRELYIFENRKVNPVVEKINDIWKRSFYEPKVPNGWKLSEEPMLGGGLADQPEQQLDEGIAPASAIEADRDARRPLR